LLLVLQQVQQVNVNSILGPKLLSFLDMEELANLTDDNIEILKSLADYLTKESAYVDDNARKHLRSFKSATLALRACD